MFDQLTALGTGLVVFAVVIVVGALILYQFAGTQACSGARPLWNSTSNLCYQAANVTNTSAASGTSYTTLTYLNTQLGTTGLAGWTPAVIAIAVGLLFLGAFMIGKARKGRY